MFSFDQIATKTAEIDKAVAELQALGHRDWVRDTVEAVHLYAHPAVGLGEDFKVRLAFNYEIFPGIEFELIEFVSGRSIQMGSSVGMTSISHFGYHVQDQHVPLQLPEDTLVRELKRLQGLGMEVVQVSETVNHEGTSKRYRYAFAFCPTVGAPIKVIQRLHADSTVEQGRELFAWLSNKS